MAIKDQVDSVIAARKKKRDELLERKQKLQEIRERISESCHEMTLRTQETQDDNLRDQYYDELGEMISARKKLDEALKSIDAVAKRFDRDYISIAMVGGNRHGRKSRVLRAIGDLDPKVIPDMNMIPDDETGATFAIWNKPNMREGEVRARISFRKPDELLRQVTNYLEQLRPEFLKNYDIQFDDIGYILYKQFRISDDPVKRWDQEIARRNLGYIVESFDDIKDLFGAPAKILTDPNIIETFVEWRHWEPSPDRQYFNYLAVASVDIYCRFYAGDIGRVRLADIVDLDNYGWSIPEETILHTIDTECDAAIVLVTPCDAGVTERDLQIYKLLREHFKNRKIDQWLYYFINHYVGCNDDSTRAWKHDAEKYGWSVADMRIVDASDPEAVENDFIVPMLKSLLNNMDEIDAAYLKEVDDKETEFRKELEKLYHKEEMKWR